MPSDKSLEEVVARDRSADQSPTDTRSQPRSQPITHEGNLQDEDDAENSGTVRRNRSPAIATNLGNSVTCYQGMLLMLHVVQVHSLPQKNRLIRPVER